MSVSASAQMKKTFRSPSWFAFSRATCSIGSLLSTPKKKLCGWLAASSIAAQPVPQHRSSTIDQGRRQLASVMDSVAAAEESSTWPKSKDGVTGTAGVQSLRGPK